MDYPNRLEWQTRCEFNAYCKNVLRNELIDATRESKTRQKHEVSFSDLSPQEEKQLYTVDTYDLDGETMGISRQDDEEAKALLTALFRGAQHEQAEEEPPDEPSNEVTDGMIDEDEEVVEPPEETEYDEDLADLAKSVNEYKNARKEMERLGFTDYDEYLDYLEYMEKRAARKKDIQM